MPTMRRKHPDDTEAGMMAMQYLPGRMANDDRDFVQCHLLTSLFEKDVEEGLALKGGFAMRTSYGSIRHTKDIDLAADPKLSVERVQSRIKAALVRLKGLGLIKDLKVTMPKQTETTLRWKINGIIGGNELHLTVEVSRRDHLPEGEVPVTAWEPPKAYGLPPAKVRAFSGRAIAAAKVDCLNNPTREAPRDIYDLHILIRSQIKPPIDLLQTMDHDRLKNGMMNLWTKIDAMDYKRVQAELIPFLPEAAARELTEEAWDDMRMTVGQHVEEWMRAVVGMEDSPNYATPGYT